MLIVPKAQRDAQAEEAAKARPVRERSSAAPAEAFAPPKRMLPKWVWAGGASASALLVALLVWMWLSSEPPTELPDAHASVVSKTGTAEPSPIADAPEPDGENTGLAVEVQAPAEREVTEPPPQSPPQTPKPDVGEIPPVDKESVASEVNAKNGPNLWPKGTGYLTKPQKRPAFAHPKRTHTDSERSNARIEEVREDELIVTGNVEHVLDESGALRPMFRNPGAAITNATKNKSAVTIADYNGDECVISYGMTVRVDEFGQFVPVADGSSQTNDKAPPPTQASLPSPADVLSFCLSQQKPGGVTPLPPLSVMRDGKLDRDLLDRMTSAIGNIPEDGHRANAYIRRLRAIHPGLKFVAMHSLSIPFDTVSRRFKGMARLASPTFADDLDKPWTPLDKPRSTDVTWYACGWLTLGVKAGKVVFLVISCDEILGDTH